MENISSPKSETMTLADDFLQSLCALEPLFASEEGFSEFDDRVGDLSPQMHSDKAQLAKATIDKLMKLEISNDNDQLCADVLRDYCNNIVDDFINDDWVRCINVLTNPLDVIQTTCYNIDEQDSTAIAKREQKIAEISSSLKSYKETFRYGAANNCLPKMSQLKRMAHNCALYANDSLFMKSEARQAYLEFGSFLTEEIVPKSDPEDAVGFEVYSRSAEHHLGKKIDVKETYEWGWEEIRSLLAEIDEVIKEISPGKTYLETIEHVSKDPERTANSPQELQEFLQNLINESLTQLNGTHFDIDPRLLDIEACLLEEVGSSVMFYAAPSDDFSRPGRTYYPVNGKKTFPLWEEVTTCYHEGLPGHHLHVGAIKCLDDKLSNFQRTVAFNTGEGEGWALYAERLMVELGLNNDPTYIFGMLNASLFRATRVVMDIGLHCGYEIPSDAPELYRVGDNKRWNREFAQHILQNVIGMSEDMATDEAYRYLGWIGQAISYKYGEKTIREIREREKARLGADFSLKDFHSRLLGYGHVGLGRLEQLFRTN